jgi:hypothetical protein
MTSEDHPAWLADLADLIGKPLSTSITPPTQKEATEFILSTLRRIGEELGYVVSPGEKFPAYLLDMIWFDDESYEIAIGVDSEWNQDIDEVKYDFENLMFVKTPVKVMAYLVSDHDKHGKVMRNGLEALLERFTHHTAGDEYLLIEFSDGWSKPQFYALHLSLDGQVKPLRFEELQGARVKLRTQ